MTTDNSNDFLYGPRIGGVYMKIKTVIIMFMIFICYSSTVYGLECPPYPEPLQSNTDVSGQLDLLKVGPIKGVTLQAKVKRDTLNLLNAYPQADKLYIESFMYAAYCSSLRDDKSISESEKSSKIKEYNKEIRKAFSASESQTINKAPDSSINSRKHETKSIRGNIKISSYDRDKLNDFVVKHKIDNFDLDLDDSILKSYNIITINIENIGVAIEDPLKLSLYTGEVNSKIIDIKWKVNNQKFKAISISHSLPKAKWIWPKNGIKQRIEWDTPAGMDEKTRFNVYRSLLKDRGFGRINPAPISSLEWEFTEKTSHESLPVYYKYSILNRLVVESDLGDTMEVGNSAPFKSFVKIEEKGNVNTATAEKNRHYLNESELEFAHGNVNISFTKGLDKNANVELYILCKLIPGSMLSPTLSLNDSPSIHFTLRGKKPVVIIPASQFFPDKIREALTPPKVSFFASEKSIFIKWDRPKTKEFSGVRIYKTPGRQIGDLHSLGLEHVIYDGAGINERIIVSPMNPNKWNSNHSARKSSESLRFDKPPARPKPILIKWKNDATPTLTTPIEPIVYLVEGIPLDNNYYIDTPKGNDNIITYVVYGCDTKGNTSYPVVINTSLSNIEDAVDKVKQP